MKRQEKEERHYNLDIPYGWETLEHAEKAHFTALEYCRQFSVHQELMSMSSA